MKITVNTEVLQKYHLSLSEFLVLLIGYYDIDYRQIVGNLCDNKLVDRDLFNKDAIVLSDNTRILVAKILTESDDRINNCGIKDFDALANSLMECYPSGNKPGTSYSWRGAVDEIAQKLRTIVVKYNFIFTEEEAIAAVKEYVSSFEDQKFMQLLKYFILKTIDDGQGHKEIDSLFMTIIENNRKDESDN